MQFFKAWFNPYSTDSREELSASSKPVQESDQAG